MEEQRLGETEWLAQSSTASWASPMFQVHCHVTTYHPSGRNKCLQERHTKERLDFLLKLGIKTMCPDVPFKNEKAAWQGGNSMASGINQP